MRRLFVSLFVVIAFLGCKEEKSQSNPLAPKVQVVKLKNQDVTVYKDFVGQVYGYKDITIRTRVEGYLEGMYFQEGNFVEEGDLLYMVDPNPLKEAVTAAQSELARSQINRDRALSDYNRIQPLAEINAVSQRDLDAAIAEKEGTEQMVEAASAKLRLAQINLGYSSIEAPVNGIIGKTQAQVGEFVGRSPNPVILNTISTIDSLRVEFFITESDYLAWTKQTTNKTDLNNDLQLILSDGSVFPHKGKVKFINREVDAVTGTLLIQSIFPNPDKLVRPGQFARVRAAVKTLQNALLVPQRCVSEIQGVFNVMRVNSEGIAEKVRVTLGDPFNDYYIVTEGLSENDQVIFEGLQRAKNGAKVTAEVVEFQSQAKAN